MDGEALWFFLSLCLPLGYWPSWTSDVGNVRTHVRYTFWCLFAVPCFWHYFFVGQSTLDSSDFTFSSPEFCYAPFLSGCLVFDSLNEQDKFAVLSLEAFLRWAFPSTMARDSWMYDSRSGTGLHVLPRSLTKIMLKPQTRMRVLWLI